MRLKEEMWTGTTQAWAHEIISFFKINIYLFYLWLRWVFIALHGPSPVAASMGYSLVGVLRLLLALASLAVCGAQALGHAGFSNCSS